MSDNTILGTKPFSDYMSVAEAALKVMQPIEADVQIKKNAEKLVAKAKKLGMSVEKKKDIKATKTTRVRESFIRFKIPEPTSWLTCPTS